jgi:glycogen(starch) synthase
VDSLLGDELFARRVARRARTMVAERYGWTSIAARTAAVYASAANAGPAPRTRAGSGAARIVVPEGNLLALDGAAC